MSLFFVRDDSSDNGFVIKQGPLARTREESYVPWAITATQQVVYAPSNQYRSKPSARGLRAYDAQVSKTRRALCHSKLGMIALENLGMSAAAISIVSQRVRQFLTTSFMTQEGVKDDYAAKVGKYAYGLSYMSFGRFSDQAPTGQSANTAMWSDAIDALKSGKPLAGVMNIHDNVGSKLLKKYDGANGATYRKYKHWADVFRADSPGELFFDDDPTSLENRNAGRTQYADPGRGRTKVHGKVEPSSKGGMTETSMGEVQLHKRGVDMFQRKAPSYSPLVKDKVGVRQQFSAICYYRDLDTRNELFGAGPSGTTGTLLASAIAFGDLQGELLKQYCLAIVGYLVGGGCHSLHESMTVMGYHPDLEYNSSSLLGYTSLSDIAKTARPRQFPILPATFLDHHTFAKWRDEFYDIVILGGTHWMFS